MFLAARRARRGAAHALGGAARARARRSRASRRCGARWSSASCPRACRACSRRCAARSRSPRAPRPGKVINALAKAIPSLIGGSADLAGSNNTPISGEASIARGKFVGRNLHFGVREHGMGALANGLALHGGIRPYVGTFLVFSDYMRPAVRLAALMAQPVVYVFTHDSIFVGEDGPTHQPVEQLAALRAIPNLEVWRPGGRTRDGGGVERGAAPGRRTDGAGALAAEPAGARRRRRRGHARRAAAGSCCASPARRAPELVLAATGSELQPALEAGRALAADGTARARRLAAEPRASSPRRTRRIGSRCCPRRSPRLLGRGGRRARSRRLAAARATASSA